jgi:hypothetical protein
LEARAFETITGVQAEHNDKNAEAQEDKFLMHQIYATSVHAVYILHQVRD